MKNKNTFKTFVKYDALEDLFKRKDVIIESTKHALERESDCGDSKFEYLDYQIGITEKGYILELIIERK